MWDILTERQKELLKAKIERFIDEWIIPIIAALVLTGLGIVPRP